MRTRPGLIALVVILPVTATDLRAQGASNGANSAANANVSAGSTATNIFNSPSEVRSRSRIDTTANAFAPGLTSAGLNSCAGSATLGGAGTGFSFGAGATFEMEECTRRANAAALAGIGQVAAAREILCDSPSMARALARTGYVCIEQRAEYQAAIRRAQDTGQMVVALPDEPAAEPVPEAPPGPAVDLPAGNVRRLRRGPPRAHRPTPVQRAAVGAAIDQTLSKSGR